MKTVEINDLTQDIELDRQAMTALVGSGIWGSVKKYARKTGRYVKRTAKRKISTYKQAYRMARSLPGDVYRMPGTVYRSAKSGFGLW